MSTDKVYVRCTKEEYGDVTRAYPKHDGVFLGVREKWQISRQGVPTRPSTIDEYERCAEIEARRSAGKPRHVLRQRVGMPRGARPVRRRTWRLKWWVIAASVSLALWGVFLAVTL